MVTNLKITFALSIGLLALSSCSEKIEEKVNTEINSTLAIKPLDWINERVNNADKKLNSTEAGQLIWRSMNAHGGLKKWFQNGPISFRFDYLPVSGKNAKKTIQQVDTWSNKAVHQSVDDVEDTFGWDGSNAWIKRNDTSAFDFDVRFWALTPYYFVGQPFIFDGQGVQLEKLADATLFDKAYDVIKISFEAGTGDAPDDYYINYFDKETHLLKAIKYIVSYPVFFKDGGHSPEKLMVLNSYQEKNGVTLAKDFSTYSTDELGNMKEIMTEVNVSDFHFMSKIENSHFEAPENAQIIKN